MRGRATWRAGCRRRSIATTRSCSSRRSRSRRPASYVQTRARLFLDLCVAARPAGAEPGPDGGGKLPGVPLGAAAGGDARAGASGTHGARPSWRGAVAGGSAAPAGPKLPRRSGQAWRRHHAYARRGTTASFAALDVANGPVSVGASPPSRPRVAPLPRAAAIGGPSSPGMPAQPLRWTGSAVAILGMIEHFCLRDTSAEATSWSNELPRGRGGSGDRRPASAPDRAGRD